MLYIINVKFKPLFQLHVCINVATYIYIYVQYIHTYIHTYVHARTLRIHMCTYSKLENLGYTIYIRTYDISYHIDP